MSCECWIAVGWRVFGHAPFCCRFDGGAKGQIAALVPRACFVSRARSCVSWRPIFAYLSRILQLHSSVSSLFASTQSHTPLPRCALPLTRRCNPSEALLSSSPTRVDRPRFVQVAKATCLLSLLAS